MYLTQEEALERVAERTYKNTKDINRDNRQRRNEVVDLFGVEYTRQGDASNPATFYISISPDMIYLDRFEFKLIIQPFTSTVQGGTDSVTVTVNSKSLSVSNNTISPNPHNHTTSAHTHNVISGVSQTTLTASNFKVFVDSRNITPYLMAQYGGSWISGEGVYPSLDVEENYDILEVASDFAGAGDVATATALTEAGYKKVEITANGPFQVTLVNYLKYSHMNR